MKSQPKINTPKPQAPASKAQDAPNPQTEVLHEANGGQQHRRAVLASLEAEEWVFFFRKPLLDIVCALHCRNYSHLKGSSFSEKISRPED